MVGVMLLSHMFQLVAFYHLLKEVWRDVWEWNLYSCKYMHVLLLTVFECNFITHFWESDRFGACCVSNAFKSIITSNLNSLVFVFLDPSISHLLDMVVGLIKAICSGKDHSTIVKNRNFYHTTNAYWFLCSCSFVWMHTTQKDL